MNDPKLQGVSEELLVQLSNNLQKILRDILSIQMTCPRCQEFTTITELSVSSISVECPVCFFEMNLTKK